MQADNIAPEGFLDDTVKKLDHVKLSLERGESHRRSDFRNKYGICRKP